MGLVPMTPARCGLNSSPSHTDARCNLPQFAKSPRGISSVLPCYCIGYYVLLWNLPATLLLVVLVPRLGGLGCQNFSRSRLARRTLHTQPAVLKALHWNLLSVVPHARGVVENLFSTASGPVSTVLRSRSGAAFCCWLGTWFHTALLCCKWALSP